MPSGSVSVEAMMANKMAASVAMINQVADAIAKAGGPDPRTGKDAGSAALDLGLNALTGPDAA
jgi:hypothetical protein